MQSFAVRRRSLGLNAAEEMPSVFGSALSFCGVALVLG